jgi:phytoene/squalene synthetase
MDLAAELAAYGPGVKSASLSLAEAQAYCRRLARSHYENFTVAGWLFPRHLRQHLCNVYAYCRWADDLADEASITPVPDGAVSDQPAQSLALLDWWEGQLDDVYREAGPQSDALPRGERETQPRHPVFVALSETIRECGLPRQPLADLLVAFRRDQVQTRYETFDDLLTYCRYSANPVGRIVLHLGHSASEKGSSNVGRGSPDQSVGRGFPDPALLRSGGRGSPDPALLQWSDSICTGLQLANFCQDVRRDYERGRIYLPLDECRRHGWDEDKFAAGQPDDGFRTLLKEQVDRAQQFLRAGEPLAAAVGRDLRLSVRLFIYGGFTILAAIRRARYDVWSQRPTVGRGTKLRLAARAWWRSLAGG